MTNKRSPEKPPAPRKFPLTPDARLFEEIGAGVLHFTKIATTIQSGASRAFPGLWVGLFGKPLATAEEIAQRVSIRKALPLLASDNISSSAYATEEILRVLILAGVGALSLTLPISFALVAVLVVVVTSYAQVIRAYPMGGGSYQATRENLGTLPGLIAAGSLLVDYVLTVSVSVAAGIEAITSAMPALYPYRVPIGLLVIAVLIVGNLRGIRESGTFFSAPTYIYLFAIFGLLGYGLFRLATGSLPTYTPPAGWVPATFEPITLLLLLRAFSSGAVALTGVEAVSNGMRILKPPESRNGTITLVLMATLFGGIFLGLGFLSRHIGLVPDPTEQETVLSQLARLLTGKGWYYLFVQASTAILLLLAANTAFVGFPRLNMILAADRFMPNQFAFRGRRLALNTGILALGALAAILLVVFGGGVAALIPLYTIGVFVAFTLSQTGMVLHWRRVKSKGWLIAMVINGVGALVTGVVSIEVVVAKFTEGAWIVLFLVPLLVLMMRAINGHYRRLGQQLHLDSLDALRHVTLPQIVIIPVADLNKALGGALAYARSMSLDIRAIHVTDTLAAAERLRQRWDEAVKDIPLIVIESPYREWTGPLLSYIDSLSQQSRDAPVTVVVPEFVPRHWWEHLLHGQSALRLKLALLSKANVVVIDIPYQIAS